MRKYSPVWLVCGLILVTQVGAAPMRVSDWDERPGDLHPWRTFLWRTDQLLSHIYDGLLGFDPDGRIVPRLAKSREWIDPKRLRLRIREGVRFHDGARFDAEVVAWNFRTLAALGPGTPRKEVFANVRRVEVESPTVVDLHLGRPDGTLENTLAAFSWMLPRRDTAEARAALISEPVGTGPYRFVASESDSRRITLAANRDYWGGVPGFDQGIEWLYLSESDRVQALLAGRLDLLGTVRPLHHVQIQTSDVAALVKADSLVELDLVFNTATRFGGDRRVRRAVALSIKADDLIRYVARGNGRLPRGQSMPGQVGYDPDAPPPEFDPGAARRLLAQAAAGGRVKLRGILDPEYLILGKSLQAQLSKVGITLELETVSRAEFFDRIVRPKLSGGGAAWGGDLFISASPDPTYHYSFINGLVSYSGGPWSMWKSPEYDRVFLEMVASRDAARATALCRQLDAIMAREVPRVRLYQVRRGYGVGRRLRFRPTRAGLIDLRYSSPRRGEPDRGEPEE